jgi:hypothetical protein
VEFAAATFLAALALFLFVYAGVSDEWLVGLRIGCWIGSILCVALCWKVIHHALAYRCWFGWDMKPKAEYIEGPKARENFERFTSAILQLPKAGTKRTAKAKHKATARKKRGKNKG